MEAPSTGSAMWMRFEPGTAGGGGAGGLTGWPLHSTETDRCFSELPQHGSPQVCVHAPPGHLVQSLLTLTLHSAFPRQSFFIAGVRSWAQCPTLKWPHSPFGVP